MVIETIDNALVLARWVPAGRSRDAEGGAWGWCLAKDWGPLRLGDLAWSKIKVCRVESANRNRLTDIENAMSSMLNRVCEAGMHQSMDILWSELRASGSPEDCCIEVLCSYRREGGDQDLAQSAASVFFKGLPHAVSRWTRETPSPQDASVLRAQLAPIRMAWQERAALSLATESDSSVSGQVKRI